MTVTTNAENLWQYKIWFSLIVELIPPFNSSPNMVREVKKICFQIPNKLRHNVFRYYMYTNADLEISLYVCVHIKIIPWKLRIRNPKNSWVICPWSL